MWEECPELFAMLGAHLAPVWELVEGPKTETLAELLELLIVTGMKLVKQSGEVMLDIKDPEKMAAHAEQAQRIEVIVKQYYEVIKQELRPVLDAGA